MAAQDDEDELDLTDREIDLRLMEELNRYPVGDPVILNRQPTIHYQSTSGEYKGFEKFKIYNINVYSDNQIRYICRRIAAKLGSDLKLVETSERETLVASLKEEYARNPSLFNDIFLDIEEYKYNIKWMAK